MADIFISYSQSDRDKVEALVRALEAEGWSVWRHPEGVAGSVPEETVDRELAMARCIVVVWSECSVGSDRAIGEADEGREQRAPIPVSLDGEWWLRWFRRFNTVLLARWDGDRDIAGLARVVAGVRASAGAPAPGGGAAPPWEHRDVPRRRPMPTWSWPAVFVALLVIAVSSYVYVDWQRHAAEKHRAEKQTTQQIDHLLADAERALGAENLTTPPGHNALEYYLEVDRLRPGHPLARRGRERIVEAFLDRANTRMIQRDWSDASRNLDRAESIGLLAAEIAAAREELGRRRAETGQADVIIRDTLGDGTRGPEMVVVPAGDFRMGSPESESGRERNEGPVHTVEVARFAIGRFEVTFDEYDAFARATGRALPSDRGIGRGWHPVINVNFEDASAYAAWLSDQTGKRYRLPTEAEWEYAARAGTQTAYWWGDEVGEGNANCSNCRGESGGERTAEVGSFPANPWGLYDTAGNVSEWVRDCWHIDYEGAPADGREWLEADTGICKIRQTRGGSWREEPHQARSAARGSMLVEYRLSTHGFRIARDL